MSSLARLVGRNRVGLGLHDATVSGREVLAKMVRKIFGAGSPVDDEVSLLDTVPDPVETHVDGFGTALAIPTAYAFSALSDVAGCG